MATPRVLSDDLGVGCRGAGREGRHHAIHAVCVGRWAHRRYLRTPVRTNTVVLLPHEVRSSVGGRVGKLDRVAAYHSGEVTRRVEHLEWVIISAWLGRAATRVGRVRRARALRVRPSVMADKP